MTILIVEDDPDLLDILCFTVRREGYDVIAAGDGAAGLQLWKTMHPELVLLDVQLPKLSGWEVCKQIRAESTTAVIMLTDAGSEAEVVSGLALGADDYITKPYSSKQLIARIGAVLRRTRESADQPRRGWQVVTVGDLKLDPQRRTVSRAEEAIRLTPIEFKLLYAMVLHEGQVLTHHVLIDQVWGYEGMDDAGPLKSHIHNLRRKLEIDAAQPRYIDTVAGVGYTFRRQVEDQPVTAAGE